MEREPNPRTDGRAADAASVAAMARGDTDALATLYDAHAPLLLGVVRRIVGTRSDAEDLVHDVFLEAWRRAADYDPARGTVRTWLVLRARSRALDHVKSAAVSRKATLPESSRMTLVMDHDPTLGADCARVRQALATLPDEQRDVMLLGYFEGLSSAEIAERVGVPIGTVKSRVAAAFQKLRSALHPDLEEKP